MSEIIFCWIKDILIFKISDIDSKYIKEITYEIAFFHEQMKYECFLNNGCNYENGIMGEYIKQIESINLKIVNKKHCSDKFSALVDYENILCMELKNNILIHCIFIIPFIINKFAVKSLFNFYFLLLILILLLFRKFLQSTITLFCLESLCTNQQVVSKDSNGCSSGFTYSEDEEDLCEDIID